MTFTRLGPDHTIGIRLAKAQFLEAGVEKLRVAVEAPDFTENIISTNLQRP